KVRLIEPAAADVRRIVAIWQDCRSGYGSGGPFLFGRFSAADAMYAPVASRFRTYLPNLARYGDAGTAEAYVEAIFALPGRAGRGGVGRGRPGTDGGRGSPCRRGRRPQTRSSLSRSPEASPARLQLRSSLATSRMTAGSEMSTAATSQMASDTAVLELRPRM